MLSNCALNTLLQGGAGLPRQQPLKGLSTRLQARETFIGPLGRLVLGLKHIERVATFFFFFFFFFFYSVISIVSYAGLILRWTPVRNQISTTSSVLFIDQNPS
jgi:hypothetical protein